jgi:hypothetical protein
MGQTTVLQLLWLIGPFAITGTGVLLTARMGRGRWLVHMAVVTALFVFPVLFVILQVRLDPTTAEHPGGGEYFAAALYLLNAAVCLPLYAAWIFYRRLNQPFAN